MDEQREPVRGDVVGVAPSSVLRFRGRWHSFWASRTGHFRSLQGGEGRRCFWRYRRRPLRLDPTSSMKSADRFERIDVAKLDLQPNLGNSHPQRNKLFSPALLTSAVSATSTPTSPVRRRFSSRPTAGSGTDAPRHAQLILDRVATLVRASHRTCQYRPAALAASAVRGWGHETLLRLLEEKLRESGHLSPGSG